MGEDSRCRGHSTVLRGGELPRSEAREIKVTLTRWELDLTLELLKKQKFNIDEEEDRILTRQYRDRLKKEIEPTLQGTD